MSRAHGQLAGTCDSAVVTIGDELVCGDVPDRNAKWLAKQLEKLGAVVRLISTLPDDRKRIADFVRWARSAHDIVAVAGGIGGTPDDVTRDAIADVFAVGRRLDRGLARQLTAQGGYAAAFASEWCRFPVGSRPLPGAPGGAPPFAIENVYVLPGAPAEMRAAFAHLRDELFVGPPRGRWHQRFRTTEDAIVPQLEAVGRRYPRVTIGSYPSFDSAGAEVDIVLRSSDVESVSEAASELSNALAGLGIAVSL